MREGPGTDTEILTTAYRNDYVVILESEGDWYKVIYNLREGYMHSDYLTVKERENVELGYGEVNTYLVNLRSGPTTSSEILDQLAEGEDAYIIGFNCGWYKVQYNGSTGYIRSDLVDLTEIPYGDRLQQQPQVLHRETPSAAPLTSPLSATKRSPSPPKATSKSPRLSPTRAMSRNLSLSPPKATNPKLLKATSRNPNPNPPKATESESSGNASSSYSAGEAIVAKAKEYLGVPYVWGGTSPSGFDCSGFTQYVMRACGYSIYRTATDQLENGYAVSYSDLQPGDLVFFERTYNTDAPRFPRGHLCRRRRVHPRRWQLRQNLQPLLRLLRQSLRRCTPDRVRAFIINFPARRPSPGGAPFYIIFHRRVRPIGEITIPTGLAWKHP